MKRILYIEDNNDTANVMKIILGKIGYDIDTANDGQTGIEKALAGNWDLIMLDVMLPDMSGWDIYGKIHGTIHSQYAFLSAIPISGERMDQLKKEGVSDYITKPFVKADLINRISVILKN